MIQVSVLVFASLSTIYGFCHEHPYRFETQPRGGTHEIDSNNKANLTSGQVYYYLASMKLSST